MATFHFNLTAGRPADEPKAGHKQNDHRKEVNDRGMAAKCIRTLKDHRKLFDAADQLEVEPPHMMGCSSRSGCGPSTTPRPASLVDITPRMISRAAQWDGDPEKLAKTLIRAGWIDEKEDGTLEIHDWYEYAGKLIDQRQARKSAPAVAGPLLRRLPTPRRTTQLRPQDDRQTAARKPEAE